MQLWSELLVLVFVEVVALAIDEVALAPDAVESALEEFLAVVHAVDAVEGMALLLLVAERPHKSLFLLPRC